MSFVQIFRKKDFLIFFIISWNHPQINNLIESILSFQLRPKSLELNPIFVTILTFKYDP